MTHHLSIESSAIGLSVEGDQISPFVPRKLGDSYGSLAPSDALAVCLAAIQYDDDDNCSLSHDLASRRQDEAVLAGLQFPPKP